jgi:hypothetical protein
MAFCIGGVTRNEYWWKNKGPLVDPKAVVDFDAQLEAAQAGYWPRPRRIIDSALKVEDQKEQYAKWLNTVFAAKVEGGIKIKNGVMKRDDFYGLYGVIEAQARVELQEQVAKNSANRKQMFSDAFDGDGHDKETQRRARQKYLGQIYEDLHSLETPMALLTTNVLKLANISEEIFDASMVKHLDLQSNGSQNLLRQFEVNLLSPCTYLADRDTPSLTSIFFRAADWSLYQVSHL